MNISYLILAHNNPHLLLSLINKLDDTNVDFYIHIDKKSKDNFQDLNGLSNVHLISNRKNVLWGGISIVETLLMCCRIISKEKGDDTTVVLLSGLDYPAKNKEYIKKYLNNNKYNFISGIRIPSSECNWLEHGRRRIECYSLRLKDRVIVTIEPRKINIGNIRQFVKIILYNPLKIKEALKIFLFYPKRLHPDYFIPFAGEFWWILPIKTLRLIIKFDNENPDFFNYHKQTSIPDEIFFNTIIYNLVDNNCIKNTCLRYIKWQKTPSPLNVTLDDKELIYECCNNKDILFIRKVVDTETREFIDNYTLQKY